VGVKGTEKKKINEEKKKKNPVQRKVAQTEKQKMSS